MKSVRTWPPSAKLPNMHDMWVEVAKRRNFEKGKGLRYQHTEQGKRLYDCEGVITCHFPTLRWRCNRRPKRNALIYRFRKARPGGKTSPCHRATNLNIRTRKIIIVFRTPKKRGKISFCLRLLVSFYILPLNNPEDILKTTSLH